MVLVRRRNYPVNHINSLKIYLYTALYCSFSYNYYYVDYLKSTQTNEIVIIVIKIATINFNWKPIWLAVSDIVIPMCSKENISTKKKISLFDGFGRHFLIENICLNPERCADPNHHWIYQLILPISEYYFSQFVRFLDFGNNIVAVSYSFSPPPVVYFMSDLYVVTIVVVVFLVGWLLLLF